MLPPVPPAGDPRLRDPIDVVKAVLDGTPPPKPPPPGPPPGGGPPAGGPPAGPPGPPRPAGTKINWKWVRRSLYACVVAAIVLPIVTFAMAYLIVDVPKPGDIRTDQVSTILASDGSELAKIVPPEGNRVDVNIDQIPVHVRNAVMAAEDRDFYTNPGFSFTGFAPRVQEQHLRRRPAGRLDHHPAVREERVGRRRAVRSRRHRPQGQGTRHLDEDVARVVQGRGAAGVPEHHLLRPRFLRHLRGVEGLLRQAGRTAHRRRGRAARRARSSGRRRWTPPSTPRAPPSGGTGCSTAW